ncbi:HSP78_2 [Sanghuangporus weigelae]
MQLKSNNAYILENIVFHARHLPISSRHVFTYPTLALLLRLSALESQALDLCAGRLFGYSPAGSPAPPWARVVGVRPVGPEAYLHDPISYFEGSVKAKSVREKLDEVLMRFGIDPREMEDVWLLTMPRYLGVEGINPLWVGSVPTYSFRLASPRAGSAVPLNAHNLLAAIAKYPFTLLLSFPRIAWQAFHLHYARPEPRAVDAALEKKSWRDRSSSAIHGRPTRLGSQRLPRLLSPLALSCSRDTVPIASIQARRYAQGPGGGAGGPGGPGGFSFAGFKPAHQKGEALKEYSIDLILLLDGMKVCRQIRRTIQILSRRTKSNPVLIGPPGVGKTAILEGLASRIVSKEVPESLHNKRVLALDLSAIMAGSGIRGAFEEKFKALRRDIEDEGGNVICFIDELHILFQLGKAEGSIDAGQMIKPALARGLQLVGATTPDEYRKTIGKDAALERRFQPVSIDEPTVESTISILRGLKPRYEVHHGVEIADAALVTAAVYGARYISDRFLPDKAIDLIDEAASALRLAQESRPDELESLERAIVTLQIELESLKNESDVFSVERRAAVEAALAEKRTQAQGLRGVWEQERARIKNAKRELEQAKYELEVAQREGQYERASRLRYATIPELLKQLPNEVDEAAQKNSPLPMLHDRVTSDDVARVVAKSTGIPVQSLLKGEKEKLVHMEDTLRQRIVGQDHIVKAVSDAVRLSRAGLQPPNRPVASFLFLGPTGVGKTELFKALASFPFNDEQRGLININMSEYHDRHTMSRLIGAAPGYVGFEEGGQLTEAVRRRPYAVILLDELEKAHKDVVMILLQILDEGNITDSQGRKVDFKNTIICLTSNLGNNILASTESTFPDGTITPSARDDVLALTQEYFPPELLNRLDATLVFNKLSRASILGVVDLRLRDVGERIRDRRMALDVDPRARRWLADRGYSDLDNHPPDPEVGREEAAKPLLGAVEE